MRLLEHRVIVPKRYTTVSVLPFACVHKDNEGHCAGHWKEYLQEVKNTKYAVAPGIGDYWDWLRTHAREWLRQYRHDKNSFNKLHDWRRRMIDKFAEELDPIKEKIPFLSLGNHHHDFADGTNDVMVLCQQLGIQYGGHGGFLRLQISGKDLFSHITLNILYHHGEKIGGGSTIGGDMNAMAKKSEGWDFDALIVAHNHKKHAAQASIVGVPKRGAMTLVEKPKVYIRAGCFMRGYVKDCVTYAEEAGLMNPTSIGYVRWDIIPKCGERDTLRYDFKVTY